MIVFILLDRRPVARLSASSAEEAAFIVKTVTKGRISAVVRLDLS